MSEFKNFWNLTLVTLAGGAEITGTMPSQGAMSITPGTADRKSVV